MLQWVRNTTVCLMSSLAKRKGASAKVRSKRILQYWAPPGPATSALLLHNSLRSYDQDMPWCHAVTAGAIKDLIAESWCGPVLPAVPLFCIAIVRPRCSERLACTLHSCRRRKIERGNSKTEAGAAACTIHFAEDDDSGGSSAAASWRIISLQCLHRDAGPP